LSCNEMLGHSDRQVHVDRYCGTSGSLWGSNPYTQDSRAVKALLHACGPPPTSAILTNLGCLSSYSSSTRNGVYSSSYGRWCTGVRITCSPSVPSATLASVPSAALGVVMASQNDAQQLVDGGSAYSARGSNHAVAQGAYWTAESLYGAGAETVYVVWLRTTCDSGEDVASPLTAYNCQAQDVCQQVTGYTCVTQSYSCQSAGTTYYPSGLSGAGSSSFNFDPNFDCVVNRNVLGIETARTSSSSCRLNTYGNICSCSDTFVNMFGLYANGRNCGNGRFFRF